MSEEKVGRDRCHDLLRKLMAIQSEVGMTAEEEAEWIAAGADGDDPELLRRADAIHERFREEFSEDDAIMVGMWCDHVSALCQIHATLLGQERRQRERMN